MEDMDVVLLLAVMLVFFAVLYISKQQEVASVPTFYTSTYNETNSVEASQMVAETDAKAADEKEYQQLLAQREIAIEEELKNQQQLEELEQSIRTFIGDDINKFGMVYYDINSNRTIKINEDSQFIAASTIKVPINMLMYDMIQDNEMNIDDKLKFKKGDYEEGAGILFKTDLSKSIPVKRLSDYSIMYSDNIAINMILRKVGRENRYNFIEEIVGHPIEHKGNFTTPMDSFKILERLYTNPDNNEYYSDLIEIMKTTIFNDRIDKYIPKEIVAHKIGNYGGCVNDIAIVYKENPYILVVLTNNMPEAEEVIAQVSKIIYDAQK